jgi:hypothetical protein
VLHLLVELSVLYKNTGKTPALKVASWIGTTDNVNAIPEFDPFPPADSNSGLMAPDGVFNTSTMSNPFQATVMEEVRAGRPLYVFGTIWYEDIYSKKHWTQFCYRVGTNLISFAPAAKHNRTDDEQNH